jgi:hypothetical protein
MSISEFNSRFTSGRETSRLFNALRRVSRLEVGAILAAEAPGWAEWPPMDSDGPEGQFARA